MNDKLESDKYYKSGFDNLTSNKKTNLKYDAYSFADFFRRDNLQNEHLNYYSDKIKPKSNEIENKIFRFDKMKKEEIGYVLSKLVIAVQEDIIILNKPNGISVEDGSGQSISILEVLPQLASALHLKDKLHIIHRLDRDTTGALLLAKNPEVAFLLKDSFKRGLVRKNYLCLVHGIPVHEAGILDFSLKEGTYNNNKMIKPDMKSIIKRSKKTDNLSPGSVCTAFKTIFSNYNVSLLQCSMISGTKHQIRAHLAYGLETPIIGDHKYAWAINPRKGNSRSININKIKPQELSNAALIGLQVDSAKTRYLPMYLHAHTINIGQHKLGKIGDFDQAVDFHHARDDEYNPQLDQQKRRLDSMRFYANLPPFFLKTLKNLKMNDLRNIKFALNNVL